MKCLSLWFHCSDNLGNESNTKSSCRKRFVVVRIHGMFWWKLAESSQHQCLPALVAMSPKPGGILRPWACCPGIKPEALGPDGSFFSCVDRVGHPPLPLRVLGHPLPAAQASGRGALTPAACRSLLEGLCGLHSTVVSACSGPCLLSVWALRSYPTDSRMGLDMLCPSYGLVPCPVILHLGNALMYK